MLKTDHRKKKIYPQQLDQTQQHTPHTKQYLYNNNNKPYFTNTPSI
jgi:hypothetical protein